jgi:hypothetical protein
MADGLPSFGRPLWKQHYLSHRWSLWRCSRKSRPFYHAAASAAAAAAHAGLNYATDPAMNRSFYGGHASPQSILDGGVEPPEPMLELYAVLDKVGGGGGNCLL